MAGWINTTGSGRDVGTVDPGPGHAVMEKGLTVQPSGPDKAVTLFAHNIRNSLNSGKIHRGCI
jgi:hypothetical protein